MRGRKTPDTKRAEAVGLALVQGVREASESTGIPQRTLRDWVNDPEFAELRRRNKEEVSEEWWAGVQTAFRRAVELLDKTDDPVKAATAGAIMFDKMSLSRGEATSRSESKDITRELDPDTRRRITAWFDQHMDTDTGGTDGVPEDAGAEVREPAAG